MNFLNHKRKRSISPVKQASSSIYDQHNLIKKNIYHTNDHQLFSNSNLNINFNNNKSNKEIIIINKNNQTCNFSTGKYQSTAKNENDNYNSQQYENKLKSNKLFSNAIAKVASSFLKEKKILSTIDYKKK